MGRHTNKPDLNKPIREAEFVIDFFKFYDLNGDHKISPSELDEEHTVNRNSYWHAFCEENEICGGITVSDMSRLIQDGDAMQGIMWFAPAMESNWKLEPKGLEKKKGAFQEIEKQRPRLKRMYPEVASTAITTLRDFWVRFNSWSDGNACPEFISKDFVRRLMEDAETLDRKKFAGAADTLYRNTVRLMDTIAGFENKFNRPKDMPFVSEGLIKNLRSLDIKMSPEKFAGRSEAILAGSLKEVALIDKFWAQYHAHVGKKEDNLFYKDAMTQYIKASAENQPPESFARILAELGKKCLDLKDPKQLVEWAMGSAKIHRDYSALKERRLDGRAPDGSERVDVLEMSEGGSKSKKVALNIPSGWKRVLVLNKSSNKIELHQVEKGFIYEKGGAYVPLVATRSNDRVELFSENMSEFTPWLASLGRIHLYEAVSSAEAFLNKKKINMQVDGMKDVPVTQVISKEMIMALIYTERDPNNLEGVKSREEFLNYASNVDIIIALKGDRAYVDDISDVSATGIAQLMRGTYDDIRKYFPERRFPGLTRPTYEETVESMEDSLVAMYLLLERKVEIIAEQNKEIWGPDEVREHFLKSPKKPLALAIAYNQGTSIPAEYMSSGKTSLITGYAKAVGNVLKYLAPVT